MVIDSELQLIKTAFFTQLKLIIYYKLVIPSRVILRKILQLIDRKVDNQKLMVNIGGGYFLRRHWRVLDFPSRHYQFVRGTIDYEYNLTSGKPFPFENESVSLIFSSHTLEHIPQEYCAFIFLEIYRVLKPGGAVRLTMPDFDRAAEAFANDDLEYFKLNQGKTIEEKLLDYFASYLKDKVSAKELRENFNSMSRESFADYYTSKIPRESQIEDSGRHVNWWNYEKTLKMLNNADFIEVYRSVPQRSCFAEMRGVGQRNGFDSTHPEISLIVEAVK